MKNDLKHSKNYGMKATNTSGYILYYAKPKPHRTKNFRFTPDHGKWFALRIRSKKEIHKNDWNFGKGTAKPKNEDLRKFNSYLQECKESWSGISENCNWKMNPLPLHLSKMLCRYYKEKITRTRYGGKSHNSMMQQVLKKGSMRTILRRKSISKHF